MSNTLVSLPLSALKCSKLNVRKTDTKIAIDELAASIQSQGLLENLIVRANDDGTYDVIGGGRRLAALKRLEKQKRITSDHAVPCLLLPSDATTEAIEASLAENTVRVPLHPADQFEAFAKLQTDGLSPEDIAARFGLSKKIVQQRLKLAAISPKLMGEYRNGELYLEQLMAFTIMDDHTVQEQVWSQLADLDPSPHTIRRHLTQSHADGSDRRALFVGAKAYEKAGGHVVRDLFDDDSEGYFTDIELLNRLVAEKLEKEAEAIRKEGWGWVEVRSGNEYVDLSHYGRIHMIEIPLPDGEEARLKSLSERYDELVAALEDDENPEMNKELDQVTVELEALQDKRSIWPNEEKKQAGAIISLDYTGCPSIVRGLVKPEDRRNAARAAGDTDANGSANSKRDCSNCYADSLILDLSAHRTAALQESLAGSPGVALDALVHLLVVEVFGGINDGDSCLRIRPEWTNLEQVSPSVRQSKAMLALKKREAKWRARVPEEKGLWAWIRSLNRRDKLELLAYCVSLTIDALDRRGHIHGRDCDNLAETLELDMADWWQPTKDGFFDRLTKDQIVQAVKDACSPEAARTLVGLKKVEMAEKAEGLVVPTRWLPTTLRPTAEATGTVGQMANGTREAESTGAE